MSGPTDIEFLETGYLVNNDVLASGDELKAYLLDHRIREVRLVANRSVEPTRIAEVREMARGTAADVVHDEAADAPCFDAR